MRFARILTDTGKITWVTAKDGSWFQLDGGPFDKGLHVTDVVVEMKQYLPPVEPRAILCIGLNYRKHAEETGIRLPKYPEVFMKNPAAAVGHEQPIRIPSVCGDEVDYECELAVIIGHHCKDTSKEEALDYVLGYTIGNDVSSRMWQFEHSQSQWVRSKSYDTFAPLGPCLVTADEIANPNALSIRTYLNDEVVQDSNTFDMVFPVSELVSFLSQGTTLLPGTVIMTGTPGGIGWTRTPRRMLRGGDVVSIEIETVGKLTNPVEA